MSGLKKINERSTSFETITILNEDYIPTIPTTLTCSIDDEESGTTLRQATELTGLASNMTIVVAETENVIVNRNREHEIHVLTLDWTYSGVLGVARGTAYYRWKLMRLIGLDPV